MRALILIALLALALGACSKSGQADNTVNLDQALTADNIVSNDVTAIDAVTGADANMAADVDYSNMAYNTSQFFGTGRWGLVGEAATSADALYSPGSDFIAIENDMLADLIGREAGGEPAGELAERTRLYNEFMQFQIGRAHV